MIMRGDYPAINIKKPDGLKADGSPWRVLVVDDSLFVTKQLCQILASEGFEIAATAANGEEAVEMYKKLYPKVDLVTMDITMPTLDGVSALEQIVAFNKSAVVIMVSALGRHDLVKKALMSGAKNYIVKPLDRAKVLERIRSTVQKTATVISTTERNDVAAVSGLVKS